MLFKGLFEKSGYDVLTAKDGKHGLATALEQKPDLVILDEPVSGLDPDGRAAIAELIQKIARAGASVLRLERWARYEGAILGIALIAIGLLIVTHQH